MSAQALQRVAVRMLFDAGFARAVRRDPEAALAGVDLTAIERGWLTRPDPRAWEADPMRRWRALTGLLEEYPATGALVRRAHGDAGVLEAFFSAPAFHECIQGRRSLALAFGDHLVGGAGGVVPESGVAVAALERAVARVRRPARSAAAPWALAPTIEALSVAAGTLALYQALRARLSSDEQGLVAAVARVDLADLPALTEGREHLVVELGASGDAGVSVADEALVALLEAARGGTTTERLLAVAQRYGCAPGEDAEVLADLATEGLLVRGGGAG